MPVVVLVGAVGLKVGPVIKFIRSDMLLLLREIFVVMDKTHCCGIIITGSLESLVRHQVSHYRGHLHFHSDPAIYWLPWDQNHWTLSYLNWNWFPFLQEFWLWTFSGGAVLMSEPFLIPRGKKISTRTGKLYYYQNTLSPLTGTFKKEKCLDYIQWLCRSFCFDKRILMGVLPLFSIYCIKVVELEIDFLILAQWSI